jgi:hypothetical protein
VVTWFADGTDRMTDRMTDQPGSALLDLSLPV